MFRKNFPGRVKERREGAVARLKAQLALGDKELRNTTKRFNNCPPNEENKKELDKHREYIKAQIEILEEKIKVSAV